MGRFSTTQADAADTEVLASVTIANKSTDRRNLTRGVGKIEAARAAGCNAPGT
jgi:hypothetical protein